MLSVIGTGFYFVEYENTAAQFILKKRKMMFVVLVESDSWDCR